MTPLPVAFPGYVSYKSCVRELPERGGTMVLIKYYLYESIVSVDISIEKQIRVQLRHA